MLSEKNLREIKEYEEAGIDVVAIGSHGTLDYSTKGMGENDLVKYTKIILPIK